MWTAGYTIISLCLTSDSKVNPGQSCGNGYLQHLGPETQKFPDGFHYKFFTDRNLTTIFRKASFPANMTTFLDCLGHILILECGSRLRKPWGLLQLQEGWEAQVQAGGRCEKTGVPFVPLVTCFRIRKVLRGHYHLWFQRPSLALGKQPFPQNDFRGWVRAAGDWWSLEGPGCHWTQSVGGGQRCSSCWRSPRWLSLRMDLCLSHWSPQCLDPSHHGTEKWMLPRMLHAIQRP